MFILFLLLAAFFRSCSVMAVSCIFVVVFVRVGVGFSWCYFLCLNHIMMSGWGIDGIIGLVSVSLARCFGSMSAARWPIFRVSYGQKLLMSQCFITFVTSERSTLHHIFEVYVL